MSDDETDWCAVADAAHAEWRQDMANEEREALEKQLELMRWHEIASEGLPSSEQQQNNLIEWWAPEESVIVQGVAVVYGGEFRYVFPHCIGGIEPKDLQATYFSHWRIAVTPEEGE